MGQQLLAVEQALSKASNAFGASTSALSTNNHIPACYVGQVGLHTHPYVEYQMACTGVPKLCNQQP